MNDIQLRLHIAQIAVAIKDLTCMIDTSYEDSDDTNVQLAKRLNRIYDNMDAIEKKCYE